MEDYIDDNGDNGDIYGGSKGKVGPKYIAAHRGNVNKAVVKIKYASSTATPENYKPTTTDNGVIKYMTNCYSSWAD